MPSLLCLPPALTYITLSSNSEVMAATGELPLPVPCLFPTWPGPTSSPELICPQFGQCSQVKGKGWTRSCHGTTLGQGLAAGNPWLHVVLTVNNDFVPALNRSGCELLEELLSAPSSCRQDGSEGQELLWGVPLARCLPMRHLGGVPVGRTRAQPLGTKHELGTWMLPGSIRTNTAPSARTQAEC